MNRKIKKRKIFILPEKIVQYNKYFLNSTQKAGTNICTHKIITWPKVYFFLRKESQMKVYHFTDILYSMLSFPVPIHGGH